MTAFAGGDIQDIESMCGKRANAEMQVALDVAVDVGRYCCLLSGCGSFLSRSVPIPMSQVTGHIPAFCL